MAWPVGGLLAAAAAWAIGKTALGLRVGLPGHRHARHRRDHRRGDEERGLAGARRQEHHRPAPPLAGALRGRPAAEPGFLDFVASWGLDPVTASTIVVKLLYAGMFGLVLAAI